MVSGIGGSGIQPFQRVLKEDTNLAKTSTQQATDGVVDLTNESNADTQTELNTSADQANFLRIEVGGEDYFLDLQPLTPEQREEVLNDLKAQILDPNGEVSADFNPDDFFKAIDNNTFQVGEGSSSVSFDGNVDQSQAVLDRSNEGEDTYFDFMNNNEVSLDSGGASEHVGDKNKPASWYNGFQIENGQVNTYRSSLDTRDVETPELSMQDYKDMLIADFNFNGAIDQFQELGGQDAFVQAMQERFPDHHLGQDGLKVLAENVWSYATTGSDSQGNTNIAEMQGMLYELDPRIQHSSDTNTPMSNEPFNVEGLGTPLRMGDGLHGRATILTTRHLLSGVNVENTQPTTMAFEQIPPPPWMNPDADWILDISGSMGRSNETGKSAELMEMYEAHGGVGNIATEFSERGDRAITVNGVKLTEEQVDAATIDALQLIEERLGSEALANAVGLSKLPTNGDGTTDYSKILKHLEKKEVSSQGKENTQEVGLKAAIVTMMLDPKYSEGEHTLQIVTDEPESRPQYIGFANALAEIQNVDLNLVALPTRFGKDDTQAMIVKYETEIAGLEQQIEERKLELTEELSSDISQTEIDLQNARDAWDKESKRDYPDQRLKAKVTELENKLEKLQEKQADFDVDNHADIRAIRKTITGKQKMLDKYTPQLIDLSEFSIDQMKDGSKWVENFKWLDSQDTVGSYGI